MQGTQSRSTSNLTLLPPSEWGLVNLRGIPRVCIPYGYGLCSPALTHQIKAGIHRSIAGYVARRSYFCSTYYKGTPVAVVSILEGRGAFVFVTTDVQFATGCIMTGFPQCKTPAA